MPYNPQKIEPKWQRHWQEEELFEAGKRTDLPKYYVLDMFPYPSGSGLHVGHTIGYTATDIIARFKRMKGFDVLHPMGWDSFGLPAEQYAIERGVHPDVSTRENIEVYRSQLQTMGFSYDWNREFSTSDPGYYHWTQWIFLKLLENGLAYREEANVNWCPELGTVLANDEVIDGKSERGGHEVVRKPMKQWMLRITAYADRLLEGLEEVGFPESIKAMQRDRIGRSEGADATFPIDGHEAELEIFTTRPDTMFGSTFCVLSPEHSLVGVVTTDEQRKTVDAYVAESALKSEIERSGTDAGKTGVFTGAYAINPCNQQKVPVWIADYVLMGYGTGAIMCVPGHDQRDWEFAHTFDLPIIEVITGGDIEKEAWNGDGTMVNSGFLDGLGTSEAIQAMIAWLEEKEIGKGIVRFKLRDWIFARQRYWGEPVPVVIDEEGKVHPLPENALPLEFPFLEDFQPTGSGKSPLERARDWVETVVPGSDRRASREIDTMPGSAGSSAYYLRFIDPKNPESICDREKAKHWMPVDLYLGGAEHAVGHLLYSRFWAKFLYDIGVCPVDEPYRKLVNQGMILGEDHRKMGKRYGNVVNPTDIAGDQGSDSLRVYQMFMGPIEVDKPWSTGGLQGARRFLDRVWRLFFDRDDRLEASIDDSEPTDEQNRILHQTIAKVEGDTEGLRFNTAIAQMMTFVNEMTGQERRPRAVLEPFCLLLAPYAPHLAEEIWKALGHSESLTWESYPQVDEKWLVEDTVEIAIQVNGKLRARLEVPIDIDEESLRQQVLAEERVREYTEGKDIIKFVHVPGRMVNMVVR
ncbi:MAG TPA: leucine--tRNA ligase [Planctomycetes bacterium]|nr:leucine--tRNA ligase [Planctomycetota bacterium]